MHRGYRGPIEPAAPDGPVKTGPLHSRSALKEESMKHRNWAVTSRRQDRRQWIRRAIGVACVSLAGALPGIASAWEPTKPVEFIVPAGTGGGADQMARLLQGVITKNNLMKQPMIVVNKSGGA